MNELKAIYQGKKVFITGHTGFKGAWLLKVLSLLGADIVGYALEPNTENDLFNLINGDTLCKSIIGDLRDNYLLHKTLSEFQPDYIFHLAAQPLVRLSYEIPTETFEVNAIGTANLLDGIRKLKKCCYVILITTDKVYYNEEWIYPYRETDRLGGYDPYSASKACAELIIESFRNSFFNTKDFGQHQKAIAVGRAGNVIGGGDWAKDRLLPDIARALGNSQSIIIRNPSSVRPWQHVLEPILGYLLLGAKLTTGDPARYANAYNFGPYQDDALSVEQMVQITLEKWGSGHYERNCLANQPHEASLLRLDISKAINELEWKPRLSAVNAVDITIDWYKAFYRKDIDMDKFTEKQIFNFFNV